jgi:tripartite-type tricarboxylate transporter receptor subunit TctC
MLHRRLARFATLAVLALSGGAASAQSWPDKPIHWIVPYTPGGITDVATRMVLQKIQAQTGWSSIVENKPGANSRVGAGIAAKSPADGYTFITVIAAHSANATLYAGRMPYDPVKSFAPVSLVGIAPLMLTVNNDLPAKDVGQLISYAKANPGKISYGSSGNGAAAHLTMELLKQATGIQMTHVPYKGTAAAAQDLMGGQIQALTDTQSSLLPLARSGRIRALGVFSKKRLAGAPEVPTIAEAGGPPLESSTWVMFLAPAGTPKDIVNKMSAEVSKAVASPDIRKRFEELGIEPVAGTPEEASKFLNDEIVKWAKVITTAGVKAE